MLVERLKTHLEKAEGIKNVENYDFKPKDVPKNVEETQKKSNSVTGKLKTVWKNEKFSLTEKIFREINLLSENVYFTEFLPKKVER